MKPPYAQVETLIRATARDIYRAFTEPAILKQFWLAESEATLEPGKKVRWTFMVPGASDEVIVRRMEQDHSLVLQWSDGAQTEFTIDSFQDGYCKLKIVQNGFVGDDAWDVAIETTQGFTYVVSELKVLLETGRPAGIVRDKAKLIAAQMI